jgi:hypothetical protein
MRDFQDYEHYQAGERAMLMLKLMVQGERDISSGDTLPQAGCSRDCASNCTPNATRGWLRVKSAGREPLSVT